ncbi:MAG: hypothetical protein COZ18_02575 [Flexibacter sp. CG_4_10_14_3_um_filter_32_15]|nr:MAG: hypothetical protein COZ18_02575 [Flexibacter sp. CG_4_10_14_3_um_filter_32_15]
MKLLFSVGLFVLIFQTSFAQKYEYNILGEHFSDTAYTNNPVRVTKVNPIIVTERKAIFEQPKESIYIYHQVGENENIEYILNLYQLCAPCFAKWNSFDYPNFYDFKKQKLYEGEYLKVALQKNYANGTAAEFETRTLYQNFSNRTYVYDIVNQYGISVYDLRSWNNLDEYAYYVEENSRLMVGKIEYKYVCPCLE